MINTPKVVGAKGPMMREGVGGNLKAIYNRITQTTPFNPAMIINAIDGDEDMFFRSPIMSGLAYTLPGLTKDGTGAALGFCTVKLFMTASDLPIGDVVSDASGNYSYRVGPNAGPYYAVGYIAGSPDKAGTTVNTLMPTGV